MNNPKRVYVAGRYSADNTIETLQNIGKGEQTCARLFNAGFAPFCPWHDKSYAIGLPYSILPVELFRATSMAWLEVSDAVLVISGKGEGGGVDDEIKRAEELGIPVLYDFDSLMEWRRRQVICDCFEEEEGKEEPFRPILIIDDLILVWDDDTDKLERCFAGWSKNGKVTAFHGGNNSKTNGNNKPSTWQHYALLKPKGLEEPDPGFKINDPVIVWNDGCSFKERETRYFAGWADDGRIMTFALRSTVRIKKSSACITWDNYELPKTQPNLKIDDRVVVWCGKQGLKENGYFAGWTKEGQIKTFRDGATSWSNRNRPLTEWEYYEIPEQTWCDADGTFHSFSEHNKRNQAANRIKELENRIKRLAIALEEAMEWNWMDDDAGIEIPGWVAETLGEDK
ncbi:MAG: hypothetical protein JJW03_05210 [Desulfosarcina sp.]|nr:hypothetical protein [Desulfobacterales bacterium]